MVNPIPITHTSNTDDITGAVLPAGKDIVLIKPESTPPTVMEQIIMRNVGAMELAMISRSDSIMGERVSYQPIFDVHDIAREFNPKTITFPHGGSSSNSISLWRHVGSDNPVVELDGVVTVELQNLIAGNLVEISIGTHGETRFF